MFGKTQIHRSLKLGLRAAVIMSIVLAHPALALQAVRLAWNTNPEANVTGYRVHVSEQRGSSGRVIDVAAATNASIGGLREFTTYFFAVQAYNSNGLASPLSSEIAVTTGSTPDFLANWAFEGGLRGNDAEPGAVPHSDGLPNLIKYAFGLRADRHDRRVLVADQGTVGLPLFRPVLLGGQRYFELQYIRLRSGELACRPKLSTDLVNWSPMVAPETVSPIDATWERVTQRVPIDPATNPRLFGKVEVSVLLNPRKVFDDWAASAGLGGALPEESPMGDGVRNIIRYAFNLEPSEPATTMAAGGTTGLPRGDFVRETGRALFRIQYLRRQGSGLVYQPEVSTDLLRFTPMGGTISTSEIDADWERVTVSMDLGLSVPRQLFARVSVRLP
jgi:hypothetical protein